MFGLFRAMSDLKIPMVLSSLHKIVWLINFVIEVEFRPFHLVSTSGYPMPLVNISGNGKLVGGCKHAEAKQGSSGA